MSDEDYIKEAGDPSVPADLIELHLALEDADITPKEFQEAFG